MDKIIAMTTSEPVFSIIVPIYNAEKYLDRCINSILSQTFTNFEVLLINDGSTDQSGSFCDEYQNKDSRIRVFHKKNGGVSEARNVGLNNICGSYIIFIDSDDAIPKFALQSYIEAHINFDADIVVADYIQVDMNGSTLDVEVFVDTDKEDYLHNVLLRKSSYTLWGKSFKSELFNKYRFKPGCDFGEDFMIYPKVLYDACKICKIDKNLYTYYKDDLESYTNIPFKSTYISQLYNIGLDLVSHFYNKNNVKIDCLIEEFVGVYKLQILFMAYPNKTLLNNILQTYSLDRSVEKVNILSFKHHVIYQLSNKLPSKVFILLLKLIICIR